MLGKRSAIVVDAVQDEWGERPMLETVALYYPYIHFRDDAWLKFAALYWPRITRIVPPNYHLRDSKTVRTLADELDFVHNVSPLEASIEVGGLFGQFLEQHEASLRNRYGVDKADDWGPDPITIQRMGLPKGDDSRTAKLTHIYAPKFDRALLARLFDAGLAVHTRGNQWVGVHPKLGDVYMTALAEEIAHKRHLQPVTEKELDHIGVSGWTMSRLAQALLNEPALKSKSRPKGQISAALAFVAIRAVYPKDRSIDVEKIIQIRRRYERERRLFAVEAQRLAAELKNELADARDPGEFQAKLGVAYDATLRDQLQDLERAIKDVKVDAGFGAMNMKLSVPAVLVSAAAIGGFTLNPIVALGGAVALGLAGLTRSQHQRTAKLMAESPAAYLLRIDRELAPVTLLDHIRAGFSRFVHGV
jgi:hypothetical protein